MAPKPKPRRKQTARSEKRSSPAAVAEDAAREFFGALADHEFYGPKVQHVYLHGAVTDEALEDLDAAIREANNAGEDPQASPAAPRFDPRPIVVHINSPGGYVSAGSAMRAVLARSAVPVCSLIEGDSSSAATFVSVFAQYRVMCADATALLHQGSGGFASTASGLREKMREFQHVEDAFNRDYVRRTKIDAAELEQINLRDLKLGARRCLKLGVVDRVIDPTYDVPVPRGLTIGEASKKKGLNQVVVQARYPQDYGRAPPCGPRDEGVLEACIDCVRISSSPRAGTASLKYVLFRPTQYDPATVSDAVALANHVRALPVATFLLIEQSFMPLMAVLPLLPCSHRVMYSHASLSVDGRVFVPRGAHLLEDVVENTRTQYEQIRSFLTRYTRTPASVVEGLKSSYTFFTADQCLRYGIVDEVVDA